jgi:hypothetical protein
VSRNREHVIDDLAGHNNLLQVVAWAREHGPVLPLPQLQRLCYGKASRSAFLQHGGYWTRALIDLSERARVAQLERDPKGRAVLRFNEPLPDDQQLEQAWERAFWGGDPPPDAELDDEDDPDGA